MSDLIKAFYKAHQDVACRGNPSHQAMVLATQGTGNVFNGLIACISTFGGLHGPLQQTWDLLVNPDPCAEITTRFTVELQIPGWGNSFHRDGVEPAFLPVEAELRKRDPVLMGKIDNITEFIHSMGKKIYPNPSTFTCATAMVEGVPREVMAVMVIEARLWPWAQEMLRVIRETPKI